MALGKKTGGRQKGTPNKQTKEVKQCLIDAYERLGGVDGMVEWAQQSESNLGDFYKLWVRVMPAELNADMTSSDGSMNPTVIKLVGVKADHDE